MPLLIARDGGFRCFYCKKELKINEYVYEHLNGNRNDNRPENIVLSCQSCNIKKIDSFDLQIMAQDKLKENESKNFVRERNYLEVHGSQHASTEIDINVSNSDITEQYITEKVNTDRLIPCSEALNCCAYLCRKKTGHGSLQAVRNYIALLTSEVGPFMIVKDQNGKKIIVKRSGN